MQCYCDIGTQEQQSKRLYVLEPAASEDLKAVVTYDHIFDVNGTAISLQRSGLSADVWTGDTNGLTLQA